MGANGERMFTKSVKVATGVEARYSKTCCTLRVIFWYRGKECRETLQIEPTPGNIKYCIRLRGEILNAIARNMFSYADYFPNSKKAKLFGHVASNVTIGELLNDFLQRAQKTLQPSTHNAYRRVCQAHLFPVFGKTPLRELTPMTLRNWISGLSLTGKTVNNILLPLRAILDEALNDDVIDRNPMDCVKVSKLLNKNTIKSNYMPDPFNPLEINAILSNAEGQIHNLLQFAFFTGLRISELIGLEWRDVDWLSGVVRISRAVVEKKEKCTKTQAGVRSVILLPHALEALQAQKVHTFSEGKRVFHHPKTLRPWEADQQIRDLAWRPTLQQGGVRYRNPYQMRHTYASMLLSAGENMLWLSKQMGHRDTEMLIKTYGKWIPSTHTTAGYHFINDWSNVVHTSPTTADSSPSEAS